MRMRLSLDEAASQGTDMEFDVLVQEDKLLSTAGICRSRREPTDERTRKKVVVHASEDTEGQLVPLCWYILER